MINTLKDTLDPNDEEDAAEEEQPEEEEIDWHEHLIKEDFLFGKLG